MDILDVLKGMKSGSNKTSLNVYGRAIDEITKLREQVEELEDAIRLRDSTVAEESRMYEEMSAKLALRDLENMKLREALCKATRSLYGMQVPKYYSDLIDETFTPTHLQV